MAQGVRVSVASIVKALKKSSGMIVPAAKMLGCDPSTIHRHKYKSAKIRQVIEDEREKFIDLAEIKLQQAVQRGDLRAIIFALKTVGRDRGYLPHSAVDIKARVETKTGVLIVPETKSAEDWVSAMKSAGAAVPSVEPNGDS